MSETRTVPRMPETAGFEDEPEAKVPAVQTGAAPATPANLPMNVGLVDDGDTGFEGTRQQEQQTPGLRIIQSNSPQLVRNSSAYDPNARAGDILNTATGETWDGEKGLQIVVFAKDFHFGEWIPRNEDGSGGGYRGVHIPDEPLVQELIRKHGRFKKLPWRNREDEDVELVETGQLYVLYGEGDAPLTAENARPAYISFTSTNMPVYTGYVSRHAGWKYKQNNGRMREAQARAYVWRLTTVPKSRGTQNWFIFRLELANGRTPLESLTAQQDPALYHLAGEMFDQFKAGMLKAAVDQSDVDSPSHAAGDDVPF